MKTALDIALHLLKFRARSVFEIEQKLKSKNISEEEISKTIQVLLKNELLDDTKFVKMYVKDRNLFKPSGTFLLKMELTKLGLNDNLIEDALVDQNEEELVCRALESKHRFRDFKLEADADWTERQADFQKKANFLQRRGFNLGVIMKVLKRE